MTKLTKAAREALIARDRYGWSPEADAALERLRAALSDAPGEEREAFEAWWAGLNPAPYYPGIEKEIARNAWQARAMLAARPEAPTVALTLEQVRALPMTRAPEIDGEEADGTPIYWRDRPYVSLRKLEELLRAHGITEGKEGGA